MTTMSSRFRVAESGAMIVIAVAIVTTISVIVALQVEAAHAVTPASVPYAPYEAGPVIHPSDLVQAAPYAPYTAGPVVEEARPYAPYEAGPVIHPSDLK